jgi:choline dehydrogenase-like flavoprotein
MEHPHITSGIATGFLRTFPETFLKLNYEVRQTNLGRFAGFGLSEARMRAEHLLNACAFFVRRPAYKLSEAYFRRTMADLAEVSDMLRRAAAPSVRLLRTGAGTLRRGRQLFSGLGQLIRYRLAPSDGWGIRVQLETAPDRDSRVRLSEKRDALGMPRLDLHWKMTAQDLQSYHRFEDLLFAALPGFGVRARRFQHDTDPDGWPVTLQVGMHHMGTTRMDKNPRQGVVDENCLVHGTGNLYVAGSSLFPTSGMANPTLTLIALAIRLADHIKAALAG